MRFLAFVTAAVLLLPTVFAKSEIDAKLVKFIEENKQTELRNYLKKKIPINVKNAALRLAVEKNRVKIACMLINNGANPRIKDENGITPLMIAAIKNYPSMVRLLMKMEGGLRTEDNDGNYAAIHAILRNNVEAYNELWAFKPCGLPRKQHLAEILISTLELNRPEMAKILIDNRFQFIPKDGISKALTIATRKGYFDVVKLLIEKGADINAEDSFGCTALMEACSCGHFDIAKLLIENGADVNVKDEILRVTALMLANNKNRSEEDCIKIMKLLIENGADTEVENKLTRTVLLQAAIEGRFDIVKFLIKNGANILFAKNRHLPDIFVMDRKTKQTVIGCLIKHAFTKFKDFVKQKLEKF
ncbi:MAG: ankyrin repeat domain-containing protein [Alphaproteobacteria bacterium]|nr:ankyrin repeat domain-containing protein [Alphaproteobacteria bacterium]